MKIRFEKYDDWQIGFEITKHGLLINIPMGTIFIVTNKYYKECWVDGE